MEDGFILLEDKVRKAADLVKRLKKANKELEDELGKLRPRAQEAEKKVEVLEKQRSSAAEEGRRLEALGQELRALKAEREEVRQRVARLVEVLEGLD